MRQKIDLRKIKNFFKKLPRILCEHAFLTFLLLFLIIIIAGVIALYKYSILPQKTEPPFVKKPPQFKEKDYQEILKIWQERDKNFQDAGSNNFPNPFQEIKTETGSSSPLTEQEQELQPEIPLQNLQTAINLYKFYLLKGEILSSLGDRAKLWEELGLGGASEYYGTIYQNQKLLDELKKIFNVAS